MNKAFIVFLLVCIVAAMVSCGGNNSTLVIISPSAATIVTGGTQQFTANIPVTWTVTGDGVINSAGFFTAGGTAGAATVTAIATDKISTNIATVTVVAGNTTTTTTVVSGLKHRVFVSNSYPGTLNTGILNVVDADKDLLSGATISLGGTPGFMVQSADKKGVVVFDTANNILRLVADSTEAVFGTIQLPGPTSSVLLAVQDLIGYAAVPTAQLFDGSGHVVTGAVYLLQFSAGATPLTPVAVPGAQTIAFASPISSPSIANILAFSQNCDSVTALQASVPSGILQFASLGRIAPDTNCTSGNFSRPVAAIFSTDGLTAYVLSSGPANGGTQVKVTQLDMTPTVGNPSATPPVLPAPPTVVGAPLALTGGIRHGGAQVGLLQGTTLYVAGEDSTTSGQGVLTAVDTTTMTISSQISLGPGIPNVVQCELDSTGACPVGAKIWIGSKGCALTSTLQSGCLAVFTPGTSSVILNQVSSVLSNAIDDVTGMTWLKPLNGRNVMYVAEGGEVQIYISDTAPLAPVSPQPVDIVGNVVDVKSAF